MFCLDAYPLISKSARNHQQPLLIDVTTHGIASGATAAQRGGERELRLRDVPAAVALQHRRRHRNVRLHVVLPAPTRLGSRSIRTGSTDRS